MSVDKIRTVLTVTGFIMLIYKFILPQCLPITTFNGL
jgi:hypothetical protein